MKIRNKTTNQIFEVVKGTLYPDFFEEVKPEAEAEKDKAAPEKEAEPEAEAEKDEVVPEKEAEAEKNLPASTDSQKNAKPSEKAAKKTTKEEVEKK